MMNSIVSLRARVRWLDLAAITMLIVFPLVYYFPVTSGVQVFFGNDIFRLFHPLRVELARALAQGRLPLWTPYLQAGFPVLAEGEMGAFYPPYWISHFLFSPATALSATILFHMIWLAVGMFLLARAIGLTTASAFLAGFVFGFSGFISAHLQHAPHLAVGAWMPWLVLGQQRFWHARSSGTSGGRVWVLLASAMVSLQFLAGFPPMALLNLFAMTFFGIAFAWLAWRGAAFRSTRGLTHIVAITFVPILLGAGIAASQLIPTFELMTYSIRSQDMGMEFFTSQSLDPRALSQFIFPFAYLGEPQVESMEFWGYLGILPFALAFIGLMFRRDARTWLLLAFALIALALALGGSNPVYSLLYNIPILNRLRVPARFLFPFTFGFALLAGTGFAEMCRFLRDTRSRVGMWFGALSILVVGSVIGLAYNIAHEDWMLAWNWIPFLLIALTLAILFASQQQWLTRNTFVALVVALTIVDLAAFAAPLLTLNRTMSPTEVTRALRNIQVMGSAGQGRFWWSKFPSLSFNAVRAMLYPNFSLQYEREGIAIYAPLALQRDDEYARGMSAAMRNLLNLRYYVLPLETAPPSEPSPFDETEPDGGLTLSLLDQQPAIPPTRATRIEIVSYTNKTLDLADNFVAGELMLKFDDGRTQTLPLRLGIETADWAFDGISKIAVVHHHKPTESLTFPAYLSSVGRDFEGHKYVARVAIPPATIVAIGAHANLPDAGLTIERVTLIDETERMVSLATLLGRNDLTLVFRSHVAALWENRDVMPRAFMVHRAQVVDDAVALARLRQPDFHPLQLVFLNDGAPLDVSGRANDQVAVVEYKSERIVIRAQTDAPGYLVLTDSWFPGWVAFVDGKEMPIHRADYIFRAVALTPGEHTVVFEYRPVSLMLGVAISLASICVLALGFWVLR